MEEGEQLRLAEASAEKFAEGGKAGSGAALLLLRDVAKLRETGTLRTCPGTRVRAAAWPSA